jgi:hypothetical protein
MRHSSQPEQVLDQRFFHITGLAMVLGTMVAGAIMLWLANDIGMTKPPLLIIGSRDSQATSLGEPVRFSGPVTEANSRVYSNEMVSNSP